MKNSPVRVGPDQAQGLRDYLRDGTRNAHEAVDATFGTLDLSLRSDYERFLTAHFMAVAPLQPLFAGFTKRHLGVSVPDYPALLRDDLTAIGIAPDLLPQLDVDGIDERAAGYVVAGSRLGMSMIRRRGYWHAEPAGRSSYMDDDQGIVVWRHLLKWFAEQRADQAEAEIICEAARRCFDLFKKAFAMSEGAKG